MLREGIADEAGNVTQMKLPAVPGMPAETLETVYDGRLALPANLSSNNAGVGSVVNGVIRWGLEIIGAPTL